MTAGGERYPMADPFFVLATQNPIEQEGTYPLPEAQQDRFMFKIFVDYPAWDEELDVIRRTTTDVDAEANPVITGEEIVALQQVVRRIPAADHVIEYAMRLVRATRVTETGIPDYIRDYVSWGAGPRACQYLILGGKAHAALNGRYHVSTDDVIAIAKPVLRHRIVTNFNADAEGITPDTIVDRLIETFPPKEGKVTADSDAKAMVTA